MRSSEITTDPLYIKAAMLHQVLQAENYDEGQIYAVMSYGRLISDLRMRKETERFEDARAKADAERYVQELAGAVVR